MNGRSSVAWAAAVSVVVAGISGVVLGFVLSGVIFSCSSMFQALGNTLPSLYSSATRLITYSVPLIWVSTQPWFQLKHVWYLSVATVILQMVVSLALLQKQLRVRLSTLAPAASPAATQA